jgi:sulfate adenylyltransferase subunit 2
MRKYHLNHLRALESEAIYVIREVAAQFERPVLLFSGGKDSICMAHLARKAFHPGKLPFPLMHVDTGHNFPETIEYRDRFVADMGAQLIVAHVQDSIDSGRVTEETGPYASRNSLQTVTLLDAVKEHKFDAAMGGARRDEGEGPGQGALFLLPQPLRPMGSQEPAARALEHLQRPEAHGRAFPGIPHIKLD